MFPKSTIIFFSVWLTFSFLASNSFALENQDSTTKTEDSQNTQTARKSPTLYGRIEQIAGGSGAQFPVLKEQTAQLDSRELPKTTKKGQATAFTGSIVRSFPEQFTGVWGGHLKIWTAQMDSICWQLDPDEANRTRQLMIPGREGSVNFDFSQSNTGKIDLEPAQVIFMVPMKDTNMQQEINKMLGGGQGSGLTLPGMDAKQMAGAMQQLAGSMNVPIMVSFGNINNPDVQGVSGNEIRAVVLSNTIRQLSPGVLEQQIISQENQRNKKTGRARQEFSETVVRFTSQNSNTLYVQAAAVNYTSDRKFERKLILYGTVRRGQVMQDAANPLGGLSNMTNMMPRNSGMPQFPAGQNPFQNLLSR